MVLGKTNLFHISESRCQTQNGLQVGCCVATRNFASREISLPSTQLVTVVSLIWQHILISEGHLKASSIRCINGIVCD